ncbi:MAG: hypothetical protein H0U00_13380 [Actinobacteria bacterium]|nr:hypothetical protein [Actinomycetota bacterium]
MSDVGWARRTGSWFLLVVLALLVLVGCDLSRPDASSRGLLTRSNQEDQAEMTAIVGGTLELDPDRGCVLLDGKPVVWPAGTTVTTDPPELHLPGDLTASAGDMISGAGGEVASATVRDSSMRVDGDVTTALSCAPSESQVLVFWARDGDMQVSRVGSGDRLAWASELGRASEVRDGLLALKVERAARRSGARALEVTVLALSDGRRVPAVTLEAADPASYMKHQLRGFLERIGYFKPTALAYVELRDEHDRFAWSAGRFANGGMVHPRPDLDQCSPIVHSQLALAKPPPCPAD